MNKYSNFFRMGILSMLSTSLCMLTDAECTDVANSLVTPEQERAQWTRTVPEITFRDFKGDVILQESSHNLYDTIDRLSTMMACPPDHVLVFTIRGKESLFRISKACILLRDELEEQIANGNHEFQITKSPKCFEEITEEFRLCNMSITKSGNEVKIVTAFDTRTTILKMSDGFREPNENESTLSWFIDQLDFVYSIEVVAIIAPIFTVHPGYDNTRKFNFDNISNFTSERLRDLFRATGEFNELQYI